MGRDNGMSGKPLARPNRLPFLFITMGVVFFVTGILKLSAYMEFREKCKPTDAVVVEIDESTTYEWDGNFSRRHTTIYALYVTYTYEGKTYEHIRLDGIESDTYEGGKLKVWVNIEDPTDARLPGNNLYQSIVMMLLMPVFVYIGWWIQKNLCD